MEREGAIRRNARLLALAQGFVSTSFPVLLIVGGPAAADLTHHDGASGLIWGVYFVAAAGGASAIGRWMDRIGRRGGLLLSVALLGVAGVWCGASIAAGSFVGLLAGTVPFGVALGGANLSRGAMADMYPPERRGRAVGILLAAGTVGAVCSPFLVTLLHGLAERRGFDTQVLPWVIVPIGAFGAAACVAALRPDPRDLAHDIPGVAASTIARPRRALLAIPAFKAAILAGAVGQMAMIGVMGVTPTALHDHGQNSSVISWVISFHILGMFAFAPLVGAGLDRFGRRAGLIAGSAVCGAGALAAATEMSATVVGVGLFAIGLGWSATYLAATAVISDLTHPWERAGALGFTDLLVSIGSASAGLVGGVLLETSGYRAVGLVAAVLVGGVLVVVARLRSPVVASST